MSHPSSPSKSDSNNSPSIKYHSFSPSIPSHPPCLSDPWTPLLQTPISFSSTIFTEIMLNLLKNPNITSSHLFRADIFYDSEKDETAGWSKSLEEGFKSDRTRWMKSELRPKSLEGLSEFQGLQNLGSLKSRDQNDDLAAGWEDWQWRRTWVRELIPRKPDVDSKLAQTCHLFSAYPLQRQGEGHDKEKERTLMIYIPHVSRPDDIPFYHPSVQALAFLHTWDAPPSTLDQPNLAQPPGSGTLSLHHIPFPTPNPSPTSSIPTRLHRTALNLLSIIHRHGHGRLTGYTKRVHHDIIIPQKEFQDEYTRLKQEYAQTLCSNWREVTDPRKHVFEDLGIAAWLICLWRGMYEGKGEDEDGGEKEGGRKRFPGFVDIGCGNGVLVNILVREGWSGWGFDARRRKSWEGFEEVVRGKLEERVLVPGVLLEALRERGGNGLVKWNGNVEGALKGLESELEGLKLVNEGEGCGATKNIAEIDSNKFHDGVFPEGTFIVSNHADELTAWTPLLARLSQSPFIAIPCCSHNLAGTRFRAPVTLKNRNASLSTSNTGENGNNGRRIGDNAINDGDYGDAQPKTGSLKKKPGKQPSAYASLCAYVMALTEAMGYEGETEMLRIPSTRNTAIVGRKGRFQIRDIASGFGEVGEDLVKELVRSELGKSLDHVAEEWIERARKIMKSTKDSHWRA
ncbi:MAG: tRNA(Ser) Um(44) 2'-O-methyltransferase [Bogoriella megaspora]|nr:MAG: tRNA(Ser) Um(44) 2'-O-methyltransferase [Bogoriella megaspora]